MILDWRLQKQLTVILAFVGLLVLVGIGGFLLTSGEPTCFDNVRNQGEIETDCGGPCIPCEIKNLRPLEVNYVRILKTGSGQKGLLEEGIYDVVARVRNINRSWGSRQIDYRFNLYDEFGHLLQSVPGRTYVLPAEVKYILALNIRSTTPIDRGEILINYPQESWDDYGLIPNPLRIQNQSVDRNIVSGILVNESPESWRNIAIYAVMLDPDRFPVAAGKSSLGAIEGFGRKDFRVVLPASPAGWPEVDYAKYTLDVVPETYLYDIYQPKR